LSPFQLESSVRPGCAETRSMKSMVGSVSQRELDLGVMKLQGVWPPAFACSNFLYLNYVNRMSSGSVTSTHITITSSYSFASSQISVFSVHVVSSTTRVVAKPYSEVLDFQWSLFINPVAADNFSCCFFQLPQLGQKVPETTFYHSTL